VSPNFLSSDLKREAAGREGRKQTGQIVNWVKDIWELLTLFLHLFCKFKITIK
jgi:hypothetical protein